MKPVSHFLILALSVLIATPLRAESPWRLGVQGGANIANQSWPANAPNESRVGFAAGALLEFRATNILYVETGARYIQKGSEFGDIVVTDETGPDPIGVGTQHYHFNNIEFPLLFKIIPGSGKIKPFVFFGPNIGINVASESKLTVELNSPGSSQDVFNFDVGDVDTIEFGFEAGGGGEFWLSDTVALPVTVRYARGLNSVWNGLESNGFMMTIGALFKI